MSTIPESHVEIIAIGREILDGRVIDTNSSWLGQYLKSLGLVPRHAQKVDDDIERIVEAFRIAQSRSQVVLCTGGLGPTSDDLTAEAFAKFLGVPIELNPEALRQIEEFLKKANRAMIELQKKQAQLPRGCFVLENKQGTAPGFGIELKGVQWFFMPGVPHEMKKMVVEQVQPRLPQKTGYCFWNWATHFTAESKIQEDLAHIHFPKGFELTFRTSFPENHIGLYGLCETNEQKILFEKIKLEVTKTLSRSLFYQGSDETMKLEQAVVEGLIEKKIRISTAESCTGGLVASRLTDVPDSSKVFMGGVVCYDNLVKEKELYVPKEILDEHGAVSPQVAQALADGALRKFGTDVAVATTGIAGPGGGSAEKPVGLCFIGFAQAGKTTQVEEVRSPSYVGRLRNKVLFSQKAIDMVRKSCLN
ncbi:MAG: CinA family nicotinamide mononucleotide deamidase-related protein [Bacteriovoracia bacterium]